MFYPGKKFQVPNLGLNFAKIPGIFRLFHPTAHLLILSAFLALLPVGLTAQAKQNPASSANSATGKNAQVGQAPGAQAATNTSPLYIDPTVNRRSEPGYGWLLLRTIFVLALFAGAAVLIWRWLKNRKPMGMVQDGPLKVLYEYPLAIGKGLKVIEVGREVFLIAVTQDNVNLISKIEDKESIDAIRLEAGRRKAAPRDSFGDLLAKVLPGAKVGGDPLAFTRNLRARLRRKP